MQPLPEDQVAEKSMRHKITLWYANQLPDPTEPFTDSRVVDFLNQLGRGNWFNIDRSSDPTLLGLLFQMNDPQNVNRSLGLSNVS